MAAVPLAALVIGAALAPSLAASGHGGGPGGFGAFGGGTFVTGGGVAHGGAPGGVPGGLPAPAHGIPAPAGPGFGGPLPHGGPLPPVAPHGGLLPPLALPGHPAPPIGVPPPGPHGPWIWPRHRPLNGGVFLYPGYPGYCPGFDCQGGYYYDNSNCWVNRRVFDANGHFVGWRREYVCPNGQ
jgi:hypothetical protein